MRLTKEEKTVLYSIAAVAAAGLVMTFFFSYRGKISEKPFTPQAVLVNINTAPASELDRLPGVGAVIAGRIIEYRQKHGAFKSVEELAKVRGISPQKAEKMRKFVVVDDTKDGI